MKLDRLKFTEKDNLNSNIEIHKSLFLWRKYGF